MSNLNFASLSLPARTSVDHIQGENGPELWDQILAAIPGAIIAGGAIRDWFLGVEPKDFDIFVSASEFHEPEGFSGLGHLGREGRLEEYEKLNDIGIIMRGRIAGRQADLIGMRSDPLTGAELVTDFDFGITRCWYDADGLHDTAEALQDRVNKTVTLLINTRRERALARFERFNQRNGGIYRLVEPNAA